MIGWCFGLLFLVVLLLAYIAMRGTNKGPKDFRKLKTFPLEETKEISDIRDVLASFSDRQPPQATYEQSAAIVSKLIQKEDFLCVDDLFRKSAQKLFWVHRCCASVIEGGLGVRLTVQCNLFGGTVANLGSPDQVEWLRGVFKRGELGCFLLTEKSAGVLSGLIVNTTATWNGEGFTLHSPNYKESQKVWISQGLMARWGVVIARLILDNGEDKGPHAFILDMQSKGVVREDMPQKTDFNTLDNAIVRFESVCLPKTALLSGISYVNDAGEYKLVVEEEPFSFVSVAQRLLSGRICIAGASLSILKDVIYEVEAYGKSRRIPTGRDLTTPLSDLPVMRDTIERFREITKVFEQYIILLEEEFMKVDQITPELVDKIACAKIEAIAFAINSVHALKEGVGSLSLFKHGPFGSQNDILYTFRFAEGDSAILQQKLVRDALKPLRSPVGLVKEILQIFMAKIANKNGNGQRRSDLSRNLVTLARKLNVSKDKQMGVWLESHALIREIAHSKSLLTISDTVASSMNGTRELAVFKHTYQ